MKELLRKSSVRQFLAISGTATLILSACFVMIQQSIRLSANDAPIALSQQIKASIDDGVAAFNTVPNKKIDISSNNNLWVTIADSSMRVIGSSATLDGETPLPPVGVFKYTQDHGVDRVTWQPKTGVRSAINVTTFGQSPDDGFIITGQSLKPYEDRMGIILNIAIAAWLAIISWTALITLVLSPRSKK